MAFGAAAAFYGCDRDDANKVGDRVNGAADTAGDAVITEVEKTQLPIPASTPPTTPAGSH